MNLEKLISNIVAQILPLINNRVLIFISGGTVNTEILLNVLLESDLMNYKIVMTDSAIKSLDEEYINKLKDNMVNSIDEMEEIIINSDFVLIPIMTRNTLSKVSLGIADNLVTTGIARAIMMNKEIVAVRDSYDFENPINIGNKLGRNDAYNSMISSHEKNLTNFGIKMINSIEFKDTIQEEFEKSLSKTIGKVKPVNEEKQKTKQILNKKEIRSSVVTLADIKRTQDYDEIIIQKGTLITPLAKDYINSNKISVTYNQ